MVVAADSRYWIPGSRRIGTSRPATDGRYSFRSLPPGDYVLAVVTDLEQGAQYLRNGTWVWTPITSGGVIDNTQAIPLDDDEADRYRAIE